MSQPSARMFWWDGGAVLYTVRGTILRLHCFHGVLPPSRRRQTRMHGEFSAAMHVMVMVLKNLTRALLLYSLMISPPPMQYLCIRAAITARGSPDEISYSSAVEGTGPPPVARRGKHEHRRGPKKTIPNQQAIPPSPDLIIKQVRLIYQEREPYDTYQKSEPK